MILRIYATAKATWKDTDSEMIRTRSVLRAGQQVPSVCNEARPVHGAPVATQYHSFLIFIRPKDNEKYMHGQRKI